MTRNELAEHIARRIAERMGISEEAGLRQMFMFVAQEEMGPHLNVPDEDPDPRVEEQQR